MRLPHNATSVTHNKITASQPGVCISYITTYGSDKTTLRAFRHYDHLPNQFGGKGVFKRCDADGMEFDSPEAAKAFAYERGYLQMYHRSERDRQRSRELWARELERRAAE